MAENDNFVGLRDEKVLHNLSYFFEKCTFGRDDTGGYHFFGQIIENKINFASDFFYKILFKMMTMDVRIQQTADKKMVGKQMTMTLANPQTFKLWQSFMPHRRDVQQVVGTDLFSIKIFDSSQPFDFNNPEMTFQKWAAVEVSEFQNVPQNLETLVLKGGLYAVFAYTGDPSGAENAFRYIFETWLPNSDYVFDSRPQFEILGEKYKNNHPDSEEDIYIAIKNK
ncbi:MAG: hypothetical protein RL757_2661 [Bacteroidota bacterium]